MSKPVAADREGMHPLRLTWRVLNWPEPSLPLHLDGLLCHALVSEGIAHGTFPADAAFRDIVPQLRLPLGRETREGETVWMASALAPRNILSTAMRTWTARTSGDDLAQAVRSDEVRLTGRCYVPGTKDIRPYAYKIDMSRGAMKRSFKYIPADVVDGITAYCIGDEQRLYELLSPDAGHVPYLGRGRFGVGKVLDFRIDADAEAETLWQMRVLPWPAVGTVPIHLAVRPPYWDPSNRQNAWINPEVLG